MITISEIRFPVFEIVSGNYILFMLFDGKLCYPTHVFGIEIYAIYIVSKTTLEGQRRRI